MGGMGDTRIDGSTPKNPYPECDEETGVCGAVPKPEPQVSKADALVSNVDEDWHPPMLPETKPSHLAQVAKNMSAQAPPPPATDAELRATYEKMSDAELEKEVKTLGKRLSDGGQYSGADLDTRKFHAAEAVAKTRADAARPQNEEIAGTRHLLPYFDEAMHRGDVVTVMHASSEWTPQHIGVSGTVLHAQHTWHVRGVDISANGDAASAGIDEGFHNVDGSDGFHASGGGVVAGGEVTVHKQGWGSATLGPSAGASVELSAGKKVEDGKELDCVRVGWGPLTVGACFPAPSGDDQ